MKPQKFRREGVDNLERTRVEHIHTRWVDAATLVYFVLFSVCWKDFYKYEASVSIFGALPSDSSLSPFIRMGKQNSHNWMYFKLSVQTGSSRYFPVPSVVPVCRLAVEDNCLQSTCFCAKMAVSTYTQRRQSKWVVSLVRSYRKNRDQRRLGILSAKIRKSVCYYSPTAGVSETIFCATRLAPMPSFFSRWLRSDDFTNRRNVRSVRPCHAVHNDWHQPKFDHQNLELG